MGTWVEQARMAGGYIPPSTSMNPDATVAPVLATPDAAEALVVRPGDTLILRYSRPLTAQHVENLKKRLREELPDVKPVIVQADGMVVYRAGGD